MGQGGSISENKSIILSNWVETKPNSNIFYNKVTNQQIQRHEVLINDKHELSSYANRMQDHSALICRLIYFHPKSIHKEESAKKHHAKHSSQEDIQDTNRAKSAHMQPFSPVTQHKSSPKNIMSPTQQQLQPKIYCVYTDRMMQVKQWNRDKIIDVIEGFKKLTQVYGLFKVRQHCICQNERKQVKIWINENPVSNFVIESVQSEEDMIADLAALLVSRKQKIAKELLDLQYFNQAIQHFSRLQQHDLKKYMHSTNPTNTTSNRPSGFSTNNRQSQTSQSPPFHHPSQVNNFYNVFINTDNSYTVSSSLQNSKYNLVNKGSFGYPYYSGKSNQPPPPSKESQSEQDAKKDVQKQTNTYKAQSDINIKREYSPTTTCLPAPHPTFPQSPALIIIKKTEQKDYVRTQNQTTQQTYPNHVSHSVITTKQTKPQINLQQQHSGPASECNYPTQKHQERSLMQNTSIMMFAQKTNSAIVKKASLHSQNDNRTVHKEQKSTISYMTTSQKKVPSSGLAPSSSLYSTQNPKSNLMPKFIASSHQQIKNRSTNNSNGDIVAKSHLKTDHVLVGDNLFTNKKQTGLNSNPTTTMKNDNQKQFFSNGVSEKSGSYVQNFMTPQTVNNEKGLASFKQKPTEMNRNSGGSNLKHYNEADHQTKSLIKTQYTPSARSQSKVFVKSHNFKQDQLTPHFESNRNVVSQMSTLKPPNLFNQTHTNQSTLSKKSFPKYFQDKQSAKSIQKYYEKSLEQREKSRAIIGKLEDKISPQKFVRGFGGETFQYQPSRPRDITQEVVPQVNDSQACSQEIIPPSYNQQGISAGNEIYMKSPADHYEPRRKFPSTTQGKKMKLLDVRQIEQMECRHSKPGTQVDSQQNYVHSYQGTKSNFIDPITHQKQKQLKKSNNTCFNEIQNKSATMTHSYFSHMNTNNSVLITHSQYDRQHNKKKIFETDAKKRKQFESIGKDDESDGKFRFKDLERKEVEERTQIYSNANSGSSPFYKHEDRDSQNYEDPQGRDNIVEIQQFNQRNQSFPYHPQSALRKNQKQFTFFNSNQKHPGVVHIEQIKPYEPKNRMYLKKQSLKSADQQDTLPRTTADQKEKRMFKATRTSQVLIETSQLHSSDPGHKIQQIVQKIQKQRQALLLNNNAQMILQQKLDVKQYPKFKKWQPSINVYGSIINQQQQTYGSCIKKKDYAKSQKQGTIDDKLSQQDSQKSQHQKTVPTMVHSQNLQTKKKIRKQVFNDYKGLFGDQNPFQKQETPEEKQKARRLQIKKKREEEQRMLENASSKDLLIQEKVQKQKEKHAQLKCDLSKLFTQEII